MTDVFISYITSRISISSEDLYDAFKNFNKELIFKNLKCTILNLTDLFFNDKSSISILKLIKQYCNINTINIIIEHNIEPNSIMNNTLNYLYTIMDFKDVNINIKFNNLGTTESKILYYGKIMSNNNVMQLINTIIINNITIINLEQENLDFLYYIIHNNRVKEIVLDNNYTNTTLCYFDINKFISSYKNNNILTLFSIKNLPNRFISNELLDKLIENDMLYILSNINWDYLLEPKYLQVLDYTDNLNIRYINEHLCNYLKYTNSINKVIINNINMMDDLYINYKYICDMLTYNTSITKLRYIGGASNDDKLFYKALKHNTTITSLKIIYFYFQNYIYLSKLLIKNNTINKLKLNFSDVYDGHYQYLPLLKSLSINTSITELTLYLKEINKEQLLELCNMINTNKILNKLHLDIDETYNYFTPILKSLITNNTLVIFKFDIKYNMSDYDVILLSKILQLNKTLTTLKLPEFRYNYNQFLYLKKYLLLNNTLNTLCLPKLEIFHNKKQFITEDDKYDNCADEIIEYTENISDNEDDVDYDYYCDKYKEDILEILQHNTTLTDLDYGFG